MQLTALSLALTRAGMLTFSPASLFASNEPGVWYDPSDTSTLFQDAAGTTPVTAVEQPVGLMLDKSRGLVLGPELVTNGDFSDGTTGWTTFVSGAALTASGGFGTLQSTAGANIQDRSVYQELSLVSGRFYRISGRIWSTDAFAVAVQSSTTASSGSIAATFGTSSSTANNFSVVFVATTTTMYLQFRNVGGGQVSYFDNISVRELPGNHAFQTTSTSRPVLSARYNLLTKTEQFDDAAWTKSNSFVQTNLLLRSQEFDQSPWQFVGVPVPTTSDGAPDGTSTANVLTANGVSTQHYCFQPQATTNAQRVYSVFAKAGTNNFFQIWGGADVNSFANFDLSAGTVGTVGSNFTASIVSVGNGWYRCIVTTSSSILNSWANGIVTSASASRNETNTLTTTVILWGAQLVQGTTPGDYKATYAAAAAVGYTDIYGQPFAQKLVENSSGTTHYTHQVLLPISGTAYTLTVYAKAAERSTLWLGNGVSGGGRLGYNLVAGTVVDGTTSTSNGSITPVGNGWFRCSLTVTANATTAGQIQIGMTNAADAAVISYTGDGTSGIYIWGAQLIVANQADLPYQRVNTSTDYDADPTKFPYYLKGDSVSGRAMVTNTITPGTNKVQVFAGVRKLADGSQQVIAETSASLVSNNGTILLEAPRSGALDLAFTSKGTTAVTVSQGLQAPKTAVAAAVADIAAPLTSIQTNGNATIQSILSQGTGNYGAYALNLFARNQNSLYFTGNLYSLIIRFGSNLPPETIEAVSKYVNNKTGAVDWDEVSQIGTFSWNSATTTPQAA
jgi:hypothetical protein